nr:hypothetical protein [Tanacetum cinerariifolium]
TDLFTFIQVANPNKVKVGEHERAEKEARLLDSIVGRICGPGGSAGGGGREAETGIAMGVRIVADENVVAKRPKRPRKKRQAVADASGFYPPKKLKGDHGAFSEAAIGGKSPSALRELLASSTLNVEVGVTAVLALHMATSTVFATPEHESGAPADSITGLDIHTIGASERFVISLDSSHHSSTNAFGAEVDSIIRSVVVPSVMTEAVVTSYVVNIHPVSEMGVKVTSHVHASLFQDSDFTETVKVDTVSPSYSAKQDLSMGSREFNSENMHQVFVSQWNVLNDSLLDDYDFNVGTARQACLNAEVRMRTEYCLSERKRLESECEKQAGLLKARNDEVENLKARLLRQEAKAAKAARLRAQVFPDKAMGKMRATEIESLKQRNVSLKNENESLDKKVAELQSFVFAKDLELKDLNVAVSSLRPQQDGLVDQVFGYERLKEWIEEFQDAQMKIVDDNVAKLDADLLEMACHFEEKFYPYLLTTISGRSEVNFPLLAELKSHKDASVEDIMNLLRLEGPFADAPERSALMGVWTPLSKPLSIQNLIGAASTSGSVPAVVATTMALSTTFASASSIPPITVDDYEVVKGNGQENSQGNVQGDVASFPTVDFEKEELDTTPKRDLLN